MRNLEVVRSATCPFYNEISIKYSLYLSAKNDKNWCWLEYRFLLKKTQGIRESSSTNIGTLLAWRVTFSHSMLMCVNICFCIRFNYDQCNDKRYFCFWVLTRESINDLGLSCWTLTFIQQWHWHYTSYSCSQPKAELCRDTEAGHPQTVRAPWWGTFPEGFLTAFSKFP